MFLYCDKTIKVDLHSAEVLPRGVPPPGIGGVDLGSSPNLATDHTIYELCLPSECETRILRVWENPFAWYGLRVVRRPGGGLLHYPCVSMEVIGSKSAVGGMKIVLVLKQGTSAGEFEFRNHVVFGGEPVCMFEDFKLIEGFVLRI